MFIDFRAGGREGEGEEEGQGQGKKHLCERGTLTACLPHSPDWGWNL